MTPQSSAGRGLRPLDRVVREVLIFYKLSRREGRGGDIKVEVFERMEVLRGRGLRHRPADAFATPVDDEEAAYAIAQSARHFSRRTQSLVDDKLAFSATLMRAGEVAEAKRAMAEFEHDVRGEKAELLRQVGRAKSSQASRARRSPPLQLARLLAIALMGMSLMFISVAGAAVGGFVVKRLSPDAPTPAAAEAAVATSPETTPRRSVARSVWIAPGVTVRLDRRQLQTYFKLLSGVPVNTTQLEAFFQGLPPHVAAAVRQVLERTGVLSHDQIKAVDLLLKVARAEKDKAERGTSEEAQPAADGEGSPPQEESTEGDSGTASDGNSGDGKRPRNDGNTEVSLPLPPLPLPLPSS